jgi:hypothetical protein
MADAFDSLIEAARAGRSAQAFVDQASALIESPADAVTFSCANPPYAGLFELTLPRSVWAPELQKQIEAAQSVVDTASGAGVSAKASLSA